MINLARQAFANPFFSAAGASFQPGGVSSVGRCPFCGNAVALASAIQPQTAGLSLFGAGPNLGQQQLGGFAPNPYGVSQSTALGQINPVGSQFATGVPQAINPFVTQLGSNWPGIGHPAHLGAAGRPGAYGADPRVAFGNIGQQFGYNDPNAIPGSLNPAIIGDPISSLFSQQINPLVQQQLNPLVQQQINPLAQQQLPIRPLIGAQQALGSQALIPGFTSPVTQWADPYRMFLETQWMSQLASNPFFQLQRLYGGIPEATGLGVPFGAGQQQLNPLFNNIPFYG